MTEISKKQQDAVEKILGHSFSNPSWLVRALTHSSAGSPNYERLEFLGDRVLGLVISEILLKRFEDEREGALAKRLSALVRGETLAEIGRDLSLQEYIIFSEAESGHKGADNDNVIADVVEALLGAMYMDANGGLKPCARFIEDNWEARLDTMIAPPQDPKTALQEWAQARAIDVPVYTIEDQSGPDHAPVFTVSVKLGTLSKEIAKGPSRRIAEKKAAQKMLQAIKQKT